MDIFFGTRLDAITEADLLRLLANGTTESTTLEFKEKLPADAKEARREFLRDVTSFANAEEGLLIYGIKETRDSVDKPTGEAQELTGIAVQNWDSLRNELQSLLREGVDERIDGIQLEAVALQSDKRAILVRVPASLRSPHMVIGDKGFYLRGNGTREPMTTAQIRDAVTRGESATDRVRRFVSERIKRHDSLVRMPFWSVRVVPLNRNPSALMVSDPAVFREVGEVLSTLGSSPPHYCLDGVCSAREGEGVMNYWCVAFRDGSLEFVKWLYQGPLVHPIISVEEIRDESMACVAAAWKLYRDGPLGCPTAVSFTLNHVQGCPARAASGSGTFFDDLIAPEPVLIRDIDADPVKLMYQVWDVVWNAFGKASCPRQ